MLLMRSIRTTPAARLGLLPLLVLGLASCGILPWGLKHYTPEPAVVQDGVDCASAMGQWTGMGAVSPGPDLSGSVPDGFVPVDVVRCSPVSGVSNGGTTLRVEETHLKGDYTELLAALAQPSDKDGAVNCTADMEIVPPLWLVNADGQAIQVAYPVDSCGKTRGKPDTAKALAKLTVHEITVQHVPRATGAP